MNGGLRDLPRARSSTLVPAASPMPASMQVFRLSSVTSASTTNASHFFDNSRLQIILVDLAADNCGHARYPFNKVPYRSADPGQVGIQVHGAKDVLRYRGLLPLFPKSGELDRQGGRALRCCCLHRSHPSSEPSVRRIRGSATITAGEIQSGRDVHFLNEIVVWFLFAGARASTPRNGRIPINSLQLAMIPIHPLAPSATLLVACVPN